MKTAARTFLIITADRVARAELSQIAPVVRCAARSVNLIESLRAALALGGMAAPETWIFSTEVWTQEVRLNPAQVVGLSSEQLARALSFELEAYSGIPVAESATGYREEGGGVYRVVQMSRAEFGAMRQIVASAGGRLAGVAHPGNIPEEETALAEWCQSLAARLGQIAVVRPPAPAPSPRRFLIAGAALAAVAALFIGLMTSWYAQELSRANTQSALTVMANRDLDAANRQNESLRKELAVMEKQEQQREQVEARRGALLALLQALATSRSEDVLVRGITAEGASSLVVSGLSLEAGAVDEMSIALNEQLRTAGWSAQSRSKVGKKSLPNGGPWDFALVLTHGEVTRAGAVQISQNIGE